MDKILEAIQYKNREDAFSLIEAHQTFTTKDLNLIVMSHAKEEDILFFAMYLVENKGILPDENSLYTGAVSRYPYLVDFFIEHKADLSKALEFCYFTRKDDAFSLLLARVSTIICCKH